MATGTSHPTPRLYWTIALILGVLTAIEVTIPQISALDVIKVPALLLFGAAKFLIVVGFFMHLKFEKSLYQSLFFTGAIGVLPIFIVVLLTFRAL